MFAFFRPRAVRSVVAAAACAAMLGGCVTGGGPGSSSDPSLTPEQRQLRTEADQDYNRTIAEGAVAGVVAGALIGALVGGRNRARGALIGAAAGGLVGAAAGTYVAEKKKAYVNENQRLDSMASDVRADNAKLERTIENNRRVVAYDRAELARLRADVNARRASQAELNSRISVAEQDAAAIQQMISRLQERQNDYSQARNATKSESPGASTAAMDAEIARLSRQIATLQGQLNDLNGAIAISRTG